jgi:hypothetical protein
MTDERAYWGPCDSEQAMDDEDQRRDWWRRLNGWDKPPPNFVKMWERLFIPRSCER